MLKEVITNHNNDEHEHKAVFEKVFEKIDFEGRLKDELVEQFKEVLVILYLSCKGSLMSCVL